MFLTIFEEEKKHIAHDALSKFFITFDIKKNFHKLVSKAK